jgi:predicted PurR-regulated permease PerM
MSVETFQVTARSNPSQRIIAIGIVFAFLYWASSVVIAVLLAVLIAYFLDPVVKVLEHIHIPRALGALLVLLATGAALGAVGYMIVDRLDTFATDWPRYDAVLKRSANAVDRKLSTFEKQVSEFTPSQAPGRNAVQVGDTQPVRTLLLRGLGSLYSILLVWTFLPFLIFFMLAAKRRIWQATLELFPEGERRAVRDTLDQVSLMLRSYVAGNALVALILVTACYAFFWAIHLDYPFLTAVVSGLLNLVPYLGAVLAWLPPFVIGLTQWKTAGPFLGVAGALSGLHLIAMNVLMPAIVGRRVHLNAVAVTIALLFWGWMWGAAGLILAIPITATFKVICDHVPEWQPAGRWLGA